MSTVRARTPRTSGGTSLCARSSLQEENLVTKSPAQTTPRHKSLTQLCIELEDALKTPKASDFFSVYSRVYQQHFARAPNVSLASSPRAAKAFKWVREFCEPEGIDPAMWITAQMHGLKKWLNDPERNKRKIGFMPTMLAGENAKKRYNVYVRMAQARYKRASCDTFDTQTDEGILLAELTGAEERIGEYYVRSMILGREPTLEDAVEHAAPGASWISVFLDIDPEKELMEFFKYATRLKRRFGEDRLARFKEAATIHAAFNVAERFGHGLPDWIGIADGVEFQWKALARLLYRLKPEAKQREKVTNMSGVPGFLWGGSYGG